MPMTLRELAQQIADYPWIVAVVLCLPLMAAALMRLLHGRDGGGRSPWKYGYSLVIYATCLPGIFAAVLTAYSLLLARENLLDLNLLVSIAPIVLMVLTLAVSSRWVRFAEVPGFDRISGLMGTLGITFVVLFVLDRLRIWVLFGGSILVLLIIGVVLFVLLKWSLERLVGTPDKER
jgi:hypothetical protein